MFNVKSQLNQSTTNQKNEISINNLSYMLGYNISISNNLNIYGNYSSGFQTPTTNELSNNPFAVGGFNPELNPEKVNNFEVGIKGWIQKLNLYSTISIYYMNIYDMLVSYESPQEITYYRNAGKANNTGTDIKLEYYASEYLKLVSSYSFMNFIFSDYRVIRIIDDEAKTFQLRNKYLPGIPKSRLSFSVQNYFTNILFIGLNLNWVDQYYANDFNGPPPGDYSEKRNFLNESYLKVDLTSNYTIKYKQYSLQLNLAVNNIFNEQYNGSVVPNAFGGNFFEPAPGRSYFFSVELVL